MKILALRVREVGCLREPQALEGLSGGLDVLAGPNELGKSTLFRALEAAFTVQFNSKSQALRDWMVPHTGGAPVIEVDFETGGARYRLRKQFFSAAKASLASLDGTASARGPDAEARLSELLAAAGGADRLAMLWVGQTKALEPFGLKPETGAGLKGLIAKELSAATGGRQVHAVRTQVRERLGGLVTGAKRLPRGLLKEAVDRVAALAAERGGLHRKTIEGQAAFERLRTLRQDHAALNEPAARALRAERVAASRTALENARAAAERRRTAEQTSLRIQQESAAAAAALEAFDARARQLAAITLDLAKARGHQEQTSALRLAALEQHEAAAGAFAAHTSAGHDLRLDFEAARQREAAATNHVAMTRRLAEAEALSARAAALKAQIAANGATAEVLHAAEAAGRVLEAAAATSARIAIAYEPGGAGRIARDGEPIAADAAFDIAGPTDLLIAGIGRITIAPAGADAGAASRIEAARCLHGKLLAESCVADMSALRARAQQRAVQDNEHGITLAHLAGLCPEGLEALRAQIEPQADAEAGRSAADIGAELAKAENHRKAAEAALRSAQSQVQQAELTLAGLHATLASLTDHHAALLEAHPAPGEAAQHRGKLDSAATAAAGQATQALLEVSAHRAKEPDAGQLAALERDLAASVGAEAEASQRAGQAATAMAALETSLKRDALDGIAERLAECEGELIAAERRLAALNREVAALTLLDEQFEHVAAGTRDRYLAPVLDRLSPYLSAVLPGASLSLSGTFAAEAVQRAGRSEALGRLSEGTREQIAVLVRLGLARLLADTGEPLPLILDDALVFSDDDRITAAFAALRAASTHHQVVVLTCRAKAFEALGGARLGLRSWQGFAD